MRHGWMLNLEILNFLISQNYTNTGPLGLMDITGQNLLFMHYVVSAMIVYVP